MSPNLGKRSSLLSKFLLIFSIIEIYINVPAEIPLAIPLIKSFFSLSMNPTKTAPKLRQAWKSENLKAVSLGIPEIEYENPKVRASTHLWSMIAPESVMITDSLCSIPIDMHSKKEWMLSVSCVRYVYSINLLLIFNF